MKKMEKFPYISMVNFKISLVENQCLSFRSSRSQMFFKVVVRKKLPNIRRKILTLGSLFNKVPVLQACNFIKKKLTKMFSCEYCKIFKNSIFIEHWRWLLLPFTTTFRNYYWKVRLIIVNKDHVYSTPEKHLKKVLGML